MIRKYNKILNKYYISYLKILNMFIFLKIKNLFKNKYITFINVVKCCKLLKNFLFKNIDF